jgi:hypothetical protein
MTNNNQTNQQSTKQKEISDLEKRKEQLVEAISEGSKCSPDNPFKAVDQTQSNIKKEARKRKLLEAKPKLSIEQKEDLVIKYWKKVCSVESKEELVDRAYQWMSEFDEDFENPSIGSPAFELYSIHEFENGTILAEGFNDQYKPFVKNLSIQMQAEYNCIGASEKALAHLVAQSFCRALAMQYSFYMLYEATKMNEFSIKRQQITSKELDRAYRQYLSCFQILRSLKQSPINITVKTKTANIANQQIVQDNNDA